jgi:hypothetical protein
LFDSLYKDKTLSELLQSYDGSFYSYPDIKKTCPKRTITGKVAMDCSEAEFKQSVMSKVYDFEAHSKYMDESYSYKNCTAERKLYYFLSKQTFGFGFEPFDIEHELMKMITDAGIKYVEE